MISPKPALMTARLLCLAVTLGCLGVPADVAGAERRESLPVESRFDGKITKIDAALLLPDVAAGTKVPAMIIMHGSSGARQQREYAYAQEFLNLGAAAVVIDSFKPRGIKETVRDQDQISSTAMLADAMATLRAIASRPEIDPSRIGLIGYSKGGTVASKLALKRYAHRWGYDGRDFALLIAMYPWCGDLPLDFTPAGAPLVMMLGAADTYTGLDSCKEFAARFEKAGGKAQVEILKDAQHGWDVPGSRNWKVADGQNASKCIYDELSAGTWAERTSRIVVARAGKPTPELKDAKKRCVTLGVSGGYSREAHAQSMALVKQAIGQSLRTK